MLGMTGRFLVCGLLICLPAILGCCVLGQPSYLEGRVTILPIPKEGSSPALAYSACQIMIYGTQSGQLSHVVGLDDTGFYRAEIKPGSYVIDLYRMGAVGYTANVPQVIEVNSAETLVFNISLDTSVHR